MSADSLNNVDFARYFFEVWFDGLVVYDREGSIVAANAAALACFPRDVDPIGRRNMDLGSRLAAALDPLIAEARRGGKAVADRVTPFAPGDLMRVWARAHGDHMLVLLHRTIDDVWREHDVADQLLSAHNDRSPLAVIRFDHHARIVDWSPRAESMFGWGADAVAGKTIDEIGLVYEPDRPAVGRIIDALAGGTVATNVSENRNVTRDQRVISCRWFNSLVKLAGGTGVLSLVEDVTEAVAARRTALENERRFQSLFDQSPDPIFSITIDGAIERANAAATSVRRDAPAGTAIDLFERGDRARASSALTNAVTGIATTIELQAVRGAQAVPVAATFIPIVVEGRIAGVHLVTRDLSDVKRAEHESAAYADRIRELYLVSAAANATAERQIEATIEAGCRLLGMASGSLYEAAADRAAATAGAPVPRRLARLALATDGALALDDVRGLPYLSESDGAEATTPVGAFIGAPIDVAGVRYGSLAFVDTAHRAAPFRAVDRDLVQLMGTLVGSAIERARARAHLHRLAFTDALTGLPNRAAFGEALSERLEHATASGARIAVMFLDLDRFKDINDTHGHALGDRLLQVVADRLTAAATPGDVVARMGGDEFIVAFADAPDGKRLALLAEGIASVVDQPIEIDGGEHFVTASIGVAVAPDDGRDADTLVKHADIAMYRAKERGRNTYAFFTPAFNASLRTRISQEKSLRKALDRGEFVVYYQPQIDLSHDGILGVEALVRWNHPRHGLILPDHFIPSAEHSGLIVPLGDWILETACRQVRSWQRTLLPDLRLAVNLSARQFHQRQLAEKIRRAVASAGLAPDALELEITESVAMNDAALSVQIMREIGEAGIRLAVDDFGTGYSSLGYLRRFTIDSIKIDKSFVRDIMSEPDDATIVRTVIGMAHSLGLNVVAEGVETADQLEFLRLNACDRVQGFFFSRPLPAAELEQRLAEWTKRPILSG